MEKLDLCIGQSSIDLLSSIHMGWYKNVTELRLRRNGLDPSRFPDSAVKLVEVLAQMTMLTILDLSYNRFSNGGAEPIILQISKGDSLQELYLCDTEIGLVDIKAICVLLSTPLSCLRKLHLSENSLATDSLTALSRALEDCCTVDELDLSFSCFDNHSMNTFTSMIRRNDTLKEVRLQNCDIDSVCALYLTWAISGNDVIEKCTLVGTLVPKVVSCDKL